MEDVAITALMKVRRRVHCRGRDSRGAVVWGEPLIAVCGNAVRGASGALVLLQKRVGVCDVRGGRRKEGRQRGSEGTISLLFSYMLRDEYVRASTHAGKGKATDILSRILGCWVFFLCFRFHVFLCLSLPLSLPPLTGRVS